MANQTYFCTLTAIGEAKDANAKALGTALKFTEMAVGDGNGALPVPDRNRTTLVRQVRRAPLNTLKADPLNPGQVIAEQIIPEDVGGWWIRELGLYDDAGDLVAIGNCPETYKPQLAEGSGRVQVVRMVLIMSSAATVQLKIDPAVVLATRKYADDQDTLARQFAVDQDTAHLNAQDPHPQYMTDAETTAKVAAAIAGKADLAGATFSGNIGIGATPKAWGTSALQVKAVGITESSNGAEFVYNAYRGADATWRSIATGSMSRYGQSGDHRWYSGYSNAPGDAVAWTQAMTLDATGKLGIGITTPAMKLDVRTAASDGIRVGTADNQYYGTFTWSAGSINIGAAGYGSPHLDLYTAGSLRARVHNSGNVGIGALEPTTMLEVRKDNRDTGPTITLNNRSNIPLDPNSYVVGGLWGAGLRDVRDPAYIAGIDFVRDPFANALSSRGNIVFYTGEGETLGNARLQYEKMRLDPLGNLLAGVSSGTCHTFHKGAVVDTLVANIAYSTICYVGDGYGYSSTHAAQKVLSRMDTGRSINAAGTINTNGNDYAEYYRKADTCGAIAKGDIVGVDAAGQLTDKWADAVSFLIKSTNPSYVGGDNWGSAEAIGMQEPVEPMFQAPDYAGAPYPGDAPIEPVAPIEPGTPAKLVEPTKPESDSEVDQVLYLVEMQQYQAACEEQAVAYQAARDQYALDLAAYLEQLQKYQQDKATYDTALATFQSDVAAHQAKVNDERLYFDAITMPAYQGERVTFDAKLEAARLQVDRIAYSGQVPVNVQGAKPGQYVVPVAAGDGIAGQLVDDAAITFDQYRRAVGIVQNILSDGRANVRVKPV